MGHYRPLLALVSSFRQLLVKYILYKILLMTGFKPHTYGIGSDHLVNCATTTAQLSLFIAQCPPQLRHQEVATIVKIKLQAS